MKPRLNLSLRALVLSASMMYLPAHGETLQGIYEQARQNNHGFQAARANLDAGLENESIQRAALLPQVSGTVAWSETTTEDNNTGVSGDVRNESYSIALRQNLINFEAWNQYQLGGNQADVAQSQFRLEEQDLILRTANAYFNALKAVDNLSTAKAEEQALSHRLEQTKQRFEVGLTAITEVHEAQAVYDSATANRLEAEGSVAIAFEALEVLTGNRYNAISPLKNDFPVVPPEPVERAPWEELAEENNAELILAQYQREVADSAAKVAKSRHLPTLTGSISYGNERRNMYEAPAMDADTEGLTVGLNLGVPIFAGGGISAGRRQAASQALSAKEIYLQTRRNVVQATRVSHLSVLTTAATVRARQQAITSSQSALEATQAGYDVGTRDLVDVLNAQSNLYAAQRNYYDALYNYILATLELKQAAGVLNAQDITALNEWLDKSRTVSSNG